MALLDPDSTTRFDIPHEPGEWVEIRPLCAGDLLDRDTHGGDHIRVSFDLLAAAVVAWSYEAPVSAEVMARLDLKTYEWLQETTNQAAGMRSEAEKNGSSSNSTPSTAPGLERSLVSSGTSPR